MGQNARLMSFADDKTNLAKEMLSHRVRMVNIAQTVFRSQTRPEDKFGAHAGQYVTIEKWEKLDKNSSPIPELSALGVNSPQINEVSIQVSEYGGGVAYTRKAKNIAEYMIDEKLHRLIEVNTTESMDKAAGDVYRTADVFYIPTGSAGSETGTLDTDGTVSTAATRNISRQDFQILAAHLKSNNIDKYDGSRYLAICNPFATAALFTDTAAGSLMEQYKYDMPEVLIKGELGAAWGFRFVEETNVLSSTLNASGKNGEVIVIGNDAVAEALVEAEQIKVDTWNFERFFGIAWTCTTGFGKIWTYSTDGNFQIVRFWSST